MHYIKILPFVVTFICLFSINTYGEYSLTNSGLFGNGMADQYGVSNSISGIMGQPLVGSSTGGNFTLLSGLGYIFNEGKPVIAQIQPPFNFLVSDVPNDNGHYLKLNWEKSPSEAQGLVSWYYIFRSRNNNFTSPIPISQITSIDSLIFYEQFATLLVDSVAVGKVEYTDCVPENGVTYYYWLQAVGSLGGSTKIAAGLLTGITETPGQFYVSQPFPNPFNPSTTITLSVPIDTHLSLSVYNIAGQNVAIIANEKVKAGHYHYSWNARGMPSGIYFCKVQIDNSYKMKKILLLK